MRLAKNLPPEITSYDLLKGAALILMVVDHIGYFFFPEELWLRVIGRFSAPVWFFLIGYANTRHVQAEIWIGGFIIALLWMASGQYLMPFNILFALALARRIIDPVMARALRSYDAFWGLFLLLFFMAMPSMIVIEYGTLGTMFAMLGFMRRHRQDIFMTPGNRHGFAVATALIYAFFAIMLFPAVTVAQGLALLAGMAGLVGILYMFRPVVFPRLTQVLGPFAGLVRLLGRRTLEFYVLHLIVLTGVAMALHPAQFQIFNFAIAPLAAHMGFFL